MIENNPTNVSAALDILLEEIEAEIEFFNEVGKAAFEKRDYDRVREAVAHADSITAFREKIVTIQSEWDTLAAKFHVEKEEEEKVGTSRRNLGRLRRGLRTPESAFRIPILKALVEVGGSGKSTEVLARVEPMIKNVLKKVDYQPLASDPDNLRWRNTAQWSRNILVKEGLLKEVERRGVWEITDKGRAALGNEQSDFVARPITPPVLDPPVRANSPAVLIPTERTHTTQAELRLPILQALVAFGGSGKTADVLDRVERTLGNRLTARDREISDTHPSEPRWRLAAKWSRKRMMDEGLVAKDSPHGTWEITDTGRKSLSDAK